MRKALSILGHLDDGDVEWMMRVGVVQDLPIGHVICEEGVAFEAVALVVSAQCHCVIEGGHECSLGAGELIGHISAGPSQITVTVERPGKVLVISRSEILHRYDDDDDFADRFDYVLSAFVSERMRKTLLDSNPGMDSVSIPVSGPIDLETLESSSLAGRRFELMLSRLTA